jgi:spermidine synthase
MIQWLSAPTPAGERMLVRTFLDVFPDATAWAAPGDTGLVLIASDRPLLIDHAHLAAELADPVRGHLYTDSGRTTPLDYYRRFVAGPDDLRHHAGSARLVTDDHPGAEFYLSDDPSDGSFLRRHPAPVTSVLDHVRFATPGDRQAILQALSK